MSASSAPLNHCPASLVPMILEILAVQPVPITRRTQMDSGHVKERPVSTQGIHEKTVDLPGSDYDQLLVLYYESFGSPFSCTDPQRGVTHTLSFVDKPAVVQETISNAARHYTVHVKLMKLPTAPGAGEPT